MTRYRLPIFLCLIWFVFCQGIFYVIQKNQAIGYSQLVHGQIREILKSSDFFSLGHSVSDLTNMGFIRCPYVEMTHPVQRQIMDLSKTSECQGLFRSEVFLGGSVVRTSFKSMNGDQYYLKFMTVNQSIFTLSLWGMRIAGVFMIIVGALYLGSQSRLHDLRLQAEREMAEMKYNISQQLAHDIRSPMSALSLAAASLPAGFSAQSAIILQASKRVTEIAEDLLNSSKESQENSPTEEPANASLLDVTESLEGLIREKNLELQAKNITITLHSLSLEGPGALGMRPQDLIRTLSNILNNSAEASSAGNPIHLEGWTRQGVLFLRVSDTGSGIPPDVLKRIGKDRVTTKGTVGNGLGLLTAMRLLRSHEGDLQVISREGVGTQITLSVPLRGISSTP